MKITISGDTFNRIMSACLPAVSKDDSRKCLRYIELRCFGGNGIATAVNGFIMVQYQFTYTGDDGVFCIGRFGSVCGDTEVEIEAEGKTVSVFDGRQRIVRETYTEEYIQHDKVVGFTRSQMPESTFYVDVRHLTDALRAFQSYNQSSIVRFDVYKNAAGIVIRSRSNKAALCLPMRVNNPEATMDFAEFNTDDIPTMKKRAEENARKQTEA